jgi:hypothetical protein
MWPKSDIIDNSSHFGKARIKAKIAAAANDPATNRHASLAQLGIGQLHQENARAVFAENLLLRLEGSRCPKTPARSNTSHASFRYPCHTFRSVNDSAQMQPIITFFPSPEERPYR